MLARNPLPEFIALLLWLLLAVGGEALADAMQQPRVRVVEPFIELRSGPGEGYPVYHVSESGETLYLLLRKTNWVRVRDAEGREGWARVADLRRTVDGEGRTVDLAEPGIADFRARRWEAGVMGGDFDGATTMQVHGGYWWTQNFASEAGVSRILGDFSEITLLTIDAQYQPFPAWTVAPYVILGLGRAQIRPESTLVAAEKRNEDTLQFGLGARYYFSSRYFLRLEYKDYTFFTDRDENEEAQEWKIGLSVFF